MVKRKKKFFSIFVTMLLFIGAGSMIIICNSFRDVGSFELEDYQFYLDNYSSNENVGSISDSNDAVRKAEKVWVKMYGESVKKERPYLVSYDEINDIWLIRGTLRFRMKGGVANILIDNSTGKVLAVWHSK